MGKSIFVLGGAGNMGSELTRALLRFPELERIAIGELNRAAAEALAAEVNDSRVEVVPVDISGPEKWAGKLSGYDLLMNATSFRFFDAALGAACQAGVNYADLISEPTPAQVERVRQAGITAISGLGCTPGLSNVLARSASGHFDQTLEIHIHWVSFRTVAPSEGLLDTIIWELARECPTRQYYFDGRFVVVPPFHGSKVVRFAEPVREQTVYFMPHTETVSLARNFPGVRYVCVCGTWRPELMDDFRVLNRYGLLDHAAVAANAAAVDVCEVTRARLWQLHGGCSDRHLWAFFLNVEVLGRRGERLERFIYNVSHPVEWGDHSTARMTGIPAAVGAALLARHGRIRTGLIYPEEYYDPQEFFGELRRIAPEITIERTVEVVS